jgi:hypothetical protein
MLVKDKAKVASRSRKKDRIAVPGDGERRIRDLDQVLWMAN